MPSSYTIGDHYKAFIRELVKSGRYASASEVIRDALRLMEEREATRGMELEALRLEIAEGLKGPFVAWDPEKIKREGRRILAQRSKPDAA